MALTRTFGENSWSLCEHDNVLLTVQETVQEQVVTMTLSGSLRSDTVHYFYDEMIALATMGADIVIDCKELKYISNSCQNALLSVQQKMDEMGRGSLMLRNVPKDIYEEFKKINLHELLWIE